MRKALRRFRCRPRAPIIVAGLLATPLFFSTLMAASLAIESPRRVHFLWHGRKVFKYLGPTAQNEAHIWGLAFAVVGMLLLAGLLAMLVPRGVYPVGFAALLLAFAVTHRLDLWAAHHGKRFPFGVDLIKESSPSNTLNKGEWEQRAVTTASELRWVAVAGAGAAILIAFVLELRRRHAGEGRPLFTLPGSDAASGVVRRSTLRRWL